MCHSNCYYCPLSERRWQNDVVYANERPITTDEDLLEEARLQDALGTGITGGDPILRLNRTLHYAELLKEEFSDHHIHLYTASALSKKILQEMEGLIDELRIHVTNFADISAVRKALRFRFDVGVEIPMIPSRIEETRALIYQLKQIGTHFVNLNELEYADRNMQYLRKMGFSLDTDSCRVLGSEEAALELAQEEIVHYCSAHDKDSIQLRNRFIRRARNVRKPYEEIEDGLLIKGVIRCKNAKEAQQIRDFLQDKVDLPESLIEVIGASVETHWALVEEVPLLIKETGNLKIGIEKRYPTFDRPLIEYIPIG
jgi:pyruvate formate-lyase activating enzyme-like uncharacterized protein